MLDYLEFLSKQNLKSFFILLIILFIVSVGLAETFIKAQKIFKNFLNKKINKIEEEKENDEMLTNNFEQVSKHKKDLEKLRLNIQQTEEDLQTVSLTVNSIKRSINSHNESLKDLNEKFNLLGNGMVAILRSQIIIECEKIQETKDENGNPITHISLRQFENLDGLFSSYEELGGNHTITNLRKWFNELSIDIDESK